MFFKADRALIKLNFFFHLKSKTNSVTLKKCNSHGKYYEIDLNLGNKLQVINVNNNETGPISTLSINIQILLKFLVGFRVRRI